MGGCPDRLNNGKGQKNTVGDECHLVCRCGLFPSNAITQSHSPDPYTFAQTSALQHFCSENGVVHLPVLLHSSLSHIVDFHGLCYNGVIHRGKFRQLSQIQKRVQHGQRYVTQYVIVAYHICNVKANAPFFIVIDRSGPPAFPQRMPSASVMFHGQSGLFYSSTRISIRSK